METKISLKYSGPAVDDGSMDVYQASSNVIAFSEFVVAATKVTFGDKANARAEVTGFASGSFVTNLLFSLSGDAASIFSGLPTDQLLEVIKGAFTVWKHLKGKPAAKVEYGGQHVSVENNHGQVIQVQAESFNLVLSE